MSAPRNIPSAVRDRQREASDPAKSVWVAANAGSGKTYVLAQRVINLLLDGVDPAKILCITFTKAAAANMAKQVFDRLAAWVTLDDVALDAAIGEQSGKTPSVAQRATARRLFARALETPGGLKVQTIHAFCTQLLHQFPFEANVAARFRVLDAIEETQLLEQLTLAVLLDGAAAPASALGRALATAMTAAADQTFRDVVREMIGERDAIHRWVAAAGGRDEALAMLSRTLGVDPAESLERIEEEFFSGSAIAAGEWTALAATLSGGSKTDADQARRFSDLASLSRSDRVETYLDIFCTGERSPRKSIVTKAIRDASLIERLTAEQERVCKLLERRRAVICRDRSAALFTVAYAVLSRYADEKSRRGLVGYDDLIDKALELLRNVDAAWVHYKLDLGIDHLLIDEAQDTSSKQWEIVQRLVAEFTAGAGARDTKRTIFAVGDEKQSIYSFQDAAPKEFAEIGRIFARAHRDIEAEFVFGRLEHSFRSGESILAAVDTVFKGIAASVVSDQSGFPPHIVLPDAPPSTVEIWQPTEPDERREITGWDAPFDTVTETSPRVKLARRIARTVKELTQTGERIGTVRRAVRYGDILILVRQRGPLFEAIIRALKDAHVEVAGADRLILTEHIAVMDLMVLGDALLLPEDDLALATVLRSPLFGFEDEDLFEIAWDRGNVSLRTALARKAGQNKKFAAAATLLDELTQRARREPPFDFYSAILGPGGGRRRFVGRLGLEANDALDEFLNLALDYERRETASLQGFLAWLRAARTEVKRDMEIDRNEVRVMTVHGAKGLEAPIVFLADTMTPPAGSKPPRLLKLSDGALVWAGRQADDPPPVTAAREYAQSEAEHEYRRLLYVAMTRAADRLIVCGAEGRTKRRDGCWYDLIRGALDPLLVEETNGDEKGLRFRTAASPIAEPAAAADAPAKAETYALPSWLRLSAPPEAERAAPLSPSSAFDDVNSSGYAPAPAAARKKAMERGLIVHRLMQALPGLPPSARKDALQRYIASAGKNFSPAEQSDIARQIFAVLDTQDFAEVFAPGSRAEVPIVGRIPRTAGEAIAVAGQVDRLIVADDAVLIADYKTDGIVPRQLDDAPQSYIAQLALYRAVLARIYPEKMVRAALIFTNGPVLIEVPAAAMDRALESAIPAGHAAVTAP